MLPTELRLKGRDAVCPQTKQMMVLDAQLISVQRLARLAANSACVSKRVCTD